MYEDELPEDMTDDEYALWFSMSTVDGVRIGPSIEEIRKIRSEATMTTNLVLQLTPAQVAEIAARAADVKTMQIINSLSLMNLIRSDVPALVADWLSLSAESEQLRAEVASEKKRGDQYRSRAVILAKSAGDWRSWCFEAWSDLNSVSDYGG